MSATTLTLPGSIPGLLRRGSPVLNAEAWVNPNDSSDIMPALSQEGVVSTIYPGWARHVFWWNLDHDDLAEGADLALDLSDATGRAHAAWWLASKLHPGTDVARVTWSRNGRAWFLGYAAPCPDGEMSVHSQEWSGWKDHGYLSFLDPNDPRTLEDGSRWVDAEALRLVSLYNAETILNHAEDIAEMQRLLKVQREAHEMATDYHMEDLNSANRAFYEMQQRIGKARYDAAFAAATAPGTTAPKETCQGFEIEPGVMSGCTARDTGVEDCPVCGGGA